MLDLDHPMTTHIFRAAGLLGGLKVVAQRMTVSPSSVRAEWLAKCLPHFEKLRTLARTHFARKAPFILAAVDEYEVALEALAALGDGRITVDRRDGEGPCPACGTTITKFRPLPGIEGHEDDWIIVCSQCDQPFMAAERKLDSSEGFCTWAI